MKVKREHRSQAQRLRRVLCSGGVSPELFARVKGEFESRNSRSLFILAMLGIAEGIILISGDVLSGVFTPTFPLYLTLLALCIGIAVVMRANILKKPRHVLAACFVGLSAAMIYGLGIAFSHPAPDDYPAVTFFILFVALPLMFTDVAWHMIVFQVLWACIILAISGQLSSDWVFRSNLTNAITFTAVGAVLYCTISCEHVRQVVDHLNLEYESTRLNAIQNSILIRLSNVVEGRDEDTGGHVMRTCSFVADLFEDLREKEGWRERLSDSFIDHTVLCASLHDLGKLQIPDAILNKPGPLTKEEFEEMKLHTVYGEVLVRKSLEGLVEGDELTIARNIARSHHERWDGTGYPDGLAGENIPVEARAMALADVFDALTHERCYKQAFSVEEAVQIIEEGSGTQFDPELTEVFLKRRRVEGCNVNEERARKLQRLQLGNVD